ncbi:phage holin family protein [Paenibacillus harenae]|uniref:phage holin family protein n=1 Tax=Paenibacillus harenae TaxID=306543 RepID=UPI0003F5BA81|nr:phage holin family protein [Paenibacillus harenae]
MNLLSLLPLLTLFIQGTGIYGALSGWLEAIYGEGRMLPVALLAAAIALDWITGIAAAYKDRAHASEYGRMGTLRTVFVLLLPLFAALLDASLGLPGLFFYAVTIGLIYRTWQSITVNAYRAGWERWIPKSVIQLIDGELKGKAEALFHAHTEESEHNEAALSKKKDKGA